MIREHKLVHLMTICLPSRFINTENGQDNHKCPVMTKYVFSTLDIQWSQYLGQNKLNELILGSNMIKQMIFRAYLNIAEFPAWNKLKCPELSRDDAKPKMSKMIQYDQTWS